MYCLYCGRIKHCHTKRFIKYKRRRIACRRKVQKKKRVPTRRLLHKLRFGETGVGTLSPLCERCHYPQQRNPQRYKEVTPELLYESLQRLTEWREAVSFSEILEYIKGNYPVTPNMSELKYELYEKLVIAHKAGMVCVDDRGLFRLTTNLERLRQAPKPVLTLFWELYCDTMDPLTLTVRPISGTRKTIMRQERLEKKVRSHMEYSYCSHIWAGSPACQLEFFVSVQRRAIRIVEDPKLTSGIEPISLRRDFASCNLFMSTKNKTCFCFISFGL
ncbi:uncharacterized protein LOC133517598 isoform X2 [Cydia pomonella]|uniref:uncharacterized protein LOC133517598 isoform X2 n=1 Tax=Cydia pomonella TaxID=82600 RepID=UPI002ADDFE79|nr:uncharacterized protein LOC133517598 isoform X2 [Cydia pomonella]